MSLLEVLMAVAVFAVGIGAVAHLYLGSYDTTGYNVAKNQATLLAKEGVEAVRSIKDDDFNNISAGDYKIGISENKWTLTVGEEIVDKIFTRKINISVVKGDDESWEVTASVSWERLRGGENTVSLTEQMTAWREPYSIEYNLNISSLVGGAVTTPGEGDFTYYYANEVDIVAEAGEGYVFTGWTGNVGTVANPSSASTTITIYNDYNIVAEFAVE